MRREKSTNNDERDDKGAKVALKPQNKYYVFTSRGALLKKYFMKNAERPF